VKWKSLLFFLFVLQFPTNEFQSLHEFVGKVLLQVIHSYLDVLIWVSNFCVLTLRSDLFLQKNNPLSQLCCQYLLL
jgi:hypothetical protein